jgi:tetratricopeptide (TPR) repeat protein
MAERAVRISLYAQDIPSAMTAAKLWVEVSPGDVNAHLLLGLLDIRQGKLQNAVSQLNYVIDNHELGESKAISVVGAHLLREHDKAAALTVMREIAKRYDHTLESFYALSRVAEQAGNLRVAQRSIEQALVMKPNVRELQIQYTRILALQGNTTQAISYLRQAIARQPDDKILRLSFARMLLEKHNYNEARQQFEYLLKQNPGNTDIIYALGVLDLQANRLDSAESFFKQLSKTDKRRTESSYYLGQIMERRGDNQAAIYWYDQVQSGSLHLEAEMRIANLKVKTAGLEQALDYLHHIKVNNKNEKVRLELTEGEILGDAGDYQRAMKHYDKALDRFPNNVDLLYARALMAEKVDRLDILMRDLQSILDIQPDHAHALNALGYTLADRTARYNEALKYIKRALALMPNDAAVVDSMGWVQYRLGNYDQSIRYLRRALKLNNDAEIAAHLGQVLIARGNQEEARAVIKAALEVTPDSKQLLDLLKQIP